MKRLLRVTLIVPMLVLALGFVTADDLCAQSCGMVPMKPMVPMGCSDLMPQCRCNSNGQNCYWEWVCVR